MNLKPYPEYKDSGVQWLGDVPKHWDILRAKHVFKTIDIRSKNGTEELLSVSGRLGVSPRKNVNVTMFKAESYVGYKLCWSGDLVVNSLWAWMQGLGFSKHHGIISSAYGVYRLSKELSNDFKFFDYLLRSNAYLWELRVNSKGIWRSRYQLTDDSFFCIPIIIPESEDRKKISRFLDYKTTQIARFIKAKKQMIELLKEQKQVIINDAVTGKIVIKDEGGRLKAEKRPDSSFIPHPSSFLQTVPEGWEVKRIKSISHIRYGLGQPPKEKEDGLPLIRATNVDHGKIVIKDLLRIDINDVPASRDAVLREGEIIVVRSGAYTADSAIIPKEYTGSVAGYDMVMTVFKAMPEYVALALLSKYLRDDQLIQASMRAAQPHLNKEELGSSFIILPQNEEQEIIVLVTEKKLNALAQAISRTEREIALMQEYRTRLISDVVTGKVDVRDIKIPEIADIDDIIDESIDEPDGEEELETAEAEE